MMLPPENLIPFVRVTDEDFAKAKFFSSVRLAESGCWLWAKGLTNQGYGSLRGQRAHQWSYRLFKGEIPQGLFVLHSCDNPQCVNPNHLRVGTAKENAHDMVSRGRARPKNGTDNGMDKLTEADVQAIRASTESPTVLAKRYGIDRTNVWLICKGKAWAHVPLPTARSVKADGRKKISDAQVAEILSAYGTVPQAQLARKFSVSAALVHAIVHGRARTASVILRKE